jgi:hypothetical protein
MAYERGQVICDCLPYCQHDGKPPTPQKCRARSDWYVTLCSQGQCPGPFDKRCCHKPAEDWSPDPFAE